tara:strand:- start:177 stop:893 length:717 start_codon:yes stop_codon:yes gene_type:complete
MTLEKHTKIIFENIKIENQIDFFNLWKEIFNLIYSNKKANFNDPLIVSRIHKNFYLCKYFASIKSVEGDILECGVYKGFSSLLLRTLEKKLCISNKNNFFLVDSFEGLSEILEEDKPENKNIYQSKKGDLKANIDNVETLFKNFDNVHILKGWIPEIFDILDDYNRYKFIHIDLDLYQPTYDTLNYIYDKVVRGGMIITDDYQTPLFPGNKKAWEKFCKYKNIGFFSLPSGQAVIIKE